MTHRLAVLVAVLAVMTAEVAAQPSAAQPPPPPPPEAGSNVDPGVLSDANSGRTWMSPTALMDPKGTWSFHNHMLFIVGGGYAPSDKVNLSLSTFIPLTNDFPLILFATGKLQLVKSGRLRVALHGTLFYFGIDDAGDDFNFTASTVGGVASYCLDEGCHSLLNGFVAAGFLLEDSIDQSSIPFIANVALVKRISRRVKLVLEADSAFVLGELNDTAAGILAWYGLRFTSGSIGVDFGFWKPLCEGCNTSDGPPIGLPWLSFTYREL